VTILSWNVNGLRAAYRSGFADWLEGSKADIVCLQEIKTQEDPVQNGLFDGPKSKYQFYANYALKPGYSGVAVYVKEKPEKIERILEHARLDAEGRILHLEYPGFILIVLYIPHGGREKENLGYKLEIYERLFEYLKPLQDKNVILAGDFNIAHREVDLARPDNNKNNIMFTPEERAQIDKLLALGFTDTFRTLHPEGGNYSWWPYRVDARERNLGWRIDYMFTSKTLTPQLKKAFILSDVRGSDHCPVGVELTDFGD